MVTGFEVFEGNDRHIVSLKSKRCSCRVWDLTGIPCPHAIKALQYKELDPMKEIHWWYSKEAYLMAYHSKLQPVPGPKCWKIDPAEAMEPPALVNQVGRPKVKRTRDKDEALKRQTEWVAPRRGRVMRCSTCGVIGHNSRGCHKFDKSKGKGASETGQLKNKKQKLMDQVSGECSSKTRPLKSKKQMKDKLMKGHRTLIDEEDVDPIPPYQTIEIVEELPLTAPQPSQDSASSQSLFGPSPTNLDFEKDIPWRPRGVSEFKSRILQRQQQPKPTGTRQINFLGDNSVTPSELYAPKGLSWMGNACITGSQLQQLRVEKLQTTNGKGKAQQ